MTKYRETLRLKCLGLSQQSIADSCNVSKKTVNCVLKRVMELDIFWPFDKSDTDAVFAEKFFLLQSKSNPKKGCLSIITSTRNYSVTESVKNFCGPNTWRIAVQAEKRTTRVFSVLLSHPAGRAETTCYYHAHQLQTR